MKTSTMYKIFKIVKRPIRFIDEWWPLTALVLTGILFAYLMIIL